MAGRISWRPAEIKHALRPLGKRALRTDFTEEKFRSLLGKRERELNTYFQKGAVLTPPQRQRK
jgi:hypothetical protein